ncbi:unnamed protein product [Cochlearia groenlandica]
MAYHSNQGSGFRHLISPFGDTTFTTKVFVGGLAWETQSETLGRHFQHLKLSLLQITTLVGPKVTFRDPEAARRACVDASPVIDGRRANCNLASLGRPRPPPLQYVAVPNMQGHIRPTSPYVGSLQSPRGSLFGSHTYQQPHAYSYHQGVVCPYGVTPYGPDYLYSQSQGLYSPYMRQQYFQIYGVPGAINTPGYRYQYGYSLPGSHVLQLGGPSATSPMSVMQSPYPSTSASTQPRIIVQTPRSMQSSGSDQTTG